MLNILTDQSAAIGLILLAFIFLGFLFERFPTSVIAVVGAASFIALGYVDPKVALSAFSNSAVITIGAMFVLSSALVRTGAVEALAMYILKIADTSPKLAVVGLFLAVLFASAFMNNTPVVLILIPIFIELAGKLSASPRSLLIPLSYVSILGGTCTLLGTSTNILVDGVARANGQAPFTIFEISLIGLITAAAGLAYLLFIGRFLLPQIPSGKEVLMRSDAPLFLTELRIHGTSALIGQGLEKSGLTSARGVSFIGIRRKTETVSTVEDGFRFAAGDVVVVRATQAEILSLVERPDIDMGVYKRSLVEKNLETFEISIPSNAESVGQYLPEISLLSRYPIRILGVNSVIGQSGPDLQTIRIRPGDTFLVRADSSTLVQMRETTSVILSDRPQALAFRRRRAPIAIAAHIALIALAAFGVMPIAILAIMAVSIILITRCVDADEAWASLDGNVLVLIIAMLIVGDGLQGAGSVTYILDFVGPILADAPPLLVLFGIYGLTSIMTETVTNNAVAVILTPIVIPLAAQVGMEPRSLILAVMFGASASFATPIGYQTNTLVYAAGHYRFMDFIKIGVPMNILVGLASCFAIFWLTA